MKWNELNIVYDDVREILQLIIIREGWLINWLIAKQW